MDIKPSDLKHDDIIDLNLHDDLFKLHMTLKSLTQSVDNLEDYMYSGITECPDWDTINQITNEIYVWCHSMMGITDSVKNNGLIMLDSIILDVKPDSDGGD